MNRKIELDELLRAQSTPAVPFAQQPSDVVQAIIKVKVPDYVPSEVRLRAALDPFIFTAEFKHSDLDSVKMDPQVESVAISKKLNLEG